MVVTELGMVILVRLEHLANAELPMEVTKLPIVAFCNLEQPKNAEPMVVTEFGMVIPVRLEQLENAELPMDVTESGMVIPVRLVQPENA